MADFIKPGSIATLHRLGAQYQPARERAGGACRKHPRVAAAMPDIFERLTAAVEADHEGDPQGDR
jgi:hypothetical protein